MQGFKTVEDYTDDQMERFNSLKGTSFSYNNYSTHSYNGGRLLAPTIAELLCAVGCSGPLPSAPRLSPLWMSTSLALPFCGPLFM
jgi:hypothetical protein